MTNVAFQIPIISVLSYSNFHPPKKAHKPLELFRHHSRDSETQTWNKASHLNHGDVHPKYIFCSDRC